jgi:hypothetical protein
MTHTSFSRRKIVRYFLLSSLSLVLSSCQWLAFNPWARKVTLSVINTAVTKLLQTWALVKKNSTQASTSVDVAYQDLKKSIIGKEVSSSAIVEMEQVKSNLSAQVTKLRTSVDSTKSNASELFSLLESRANENSSSDLKNKMVSGIQEKRNKFSDKVKVAEEVLSKLEQSVKKYDDILGYLQVSSQLDKIDQYINDIDKIIAEGNILNSNIQVAIADGVAIINSFHLTK